MNNFWHLPSGHLMRIPITVLNCSLIPDNSPSTYVRQPEWRGLLSAPIQLGSFTHTMFLFWTHTCRKNGLYKELNVAWTLPGIFFQLSDANSITTFLSFWIVFHLLGLNYSITSCRIKRRYSEWNLHKLERCTGYFN
jgi:hypothetical protein